MLLFLIIACWLLIVCCLMTATATALMVGFWLFVGCIVLSQIRKEVERRKHARQETADETTQAEFLSTLRS